MQRHDAVNVLCLNDFRVVALTTQILDVCAGGGQYMTHIWSVFSFILFRCTMLTQHGCLYAMSMKERC
ncbi:unnamed protein product [Victoria cruziana]